MQIIDYRLFSNHAKTCINKHSVKCNYCIKVWMTQSWSQFSLNSDDLDYIFFGILIMQYTVHKVNSIWTQLNWITLSSVINTITCIMWIQSEFSYTALLLICVDGGLLPKDCCEGVLPGPLWRHGGLRQDRWRL